MGHEFKASSHKWPYPLFTVPGGGVRQVKEVELGISAMLWTSSCGSAAILVLFRLGVSHKMRGGEGERKGRTREMVWAQIFIRSGRKPNRRERAPSPLPLWFPSLTCPLSERILTGHNGYRAVTLVGVQAMPSVKAARQGKQE